VYELGKRGDVGGGVYIQVGLEREVLVDSSGDDASPRILGVGNLGKPEEGGGNC
jgi:hypothetical protein